MGNACCCLVFKSRTKKTKDRKALKFRSPKLRSGYIISGIASM